MPMIIAGLMLLWLSSVLLRGFVRTDPAALARLVRKGGGTVALVLAVVLILRGEFNLALLAAGAGLWLLNVAPTRQGRRFAAGLGRRARPQAPWGSAGGGRSPALDIVIDPSTSRPDCRFRAGPYAGRTLGRMSQAEAVDGYRWCLVADPASARLLEPYLDGRFPHWREAADLGADTGRAKPGRPSRMPDHEAYHVLGLAQGASREEIARAHRRLMKEHHPDHGGSTAAAARVNEAKDVLMRRHP